MAEEKILLSVTLDKDQLIASLTEIKEKLDSNKVSIADFKKQLKELGAKGDTAGAQQVREQLVLLEASTKKLTTSQGQLQKQLQLNSQANEAASGSYEQLLRQWELAAIKLKTLEGTLQRNATGTFELTAEYRSAAVDVAAAKDAIDRFNLSINDGRSNVGQYEKSLEGLKLQTKALTTEHKLGVQATNGITSAINLLSLAQGSGGEKTEFQKNAQIALTAAMGIQSIQLGIAAGKQVLLSASMGATTLATNVQATATGILSKVQQFLQLQFGLSAVAAKGFAIALTATGIGAIIVGIGLAVAAFQSFTASVEESAEALTKLKEAREKQAADDKYFSGLGIAALEDDLALQKLKGATLEEIHARELVISAKKLATLEEIKKRESFLNDEDLKSYQHLTREKGLLEAQFVKDLAERTTEEAKLREDARKKRKEELDKQEKDHGEFLTKEFEADKLHAQDIANLIKEFDPSLEQIANARLVTDKEVEFEKEYTAALVKELEERTQNELDAAKLIEEARAAQRQLEMIGAEALTGFVNALQENQIAAIQAKVDAGVITEEEGKKKIGKIKRDQAIMAKGEAVFNILINGPQAISKVLAQAGIAGFAASAIMAGIIALQVGAVLARPIPQFADSGLTGKRISSRDGVRIRPTAQGDNMLATVKTGEVILNEQHQNLLGGAATFRAIGVPGFATGGIVDGGLSARSVSANIQDDAMNLSVLEMIRDKRATVYVGDIKDGLNNDVRIEQNSTL